MRGYFLALAACILASVVGPGHGLALFEFGVLGAAAEVDYVHLFAHRREM